MGDLRVTHVYCGAIGTLGMSTCVCISLGDPHILWCYRYSGRCMCTPLGDLRVTYIYCGATFVGVIQLGVHNIYLGISGYCKVPMNTDNTGPPWQICKAGNKTSYRPVSLVTAYTQQTSWKAHYWLAVITSSCALTPLGMGPHSTKIHYHCSDFFYTLHLGGCRPWSCMK